MVPAIGSKELSLIFLSGVFFLPEGTLGEKRETVSIYLGEKTEAERGLEREQVCLGSRIKSDVKAFNS